MNWLCSSGWGDYNCHCLRSLSAPRRPRTDVPNYASGWNSKYWQVYRVLFAALCRRRKGGMLIGNLDREPGHRQLPDRLVSTLLGWTSSTHHLRSLFLTTMAPPTIWLLCKEFIFEHVGHQLLSWTPQSDEIDWPTWVRLAFLNCSNFTPHAGGTWLVVSNRQQTCHRVP